MVNYWRAPRLFAGETVFIVGGGPSVLAHDLKRLAGRPTIAINASYEATPFAQFLFFNDPLFWQQHAARARSTFAGRIVSTAPMVGEDLTYMRRRRPIGLTTRDDELGVEFTSMTGALDLAYLFGARRIVTLGLDGQADGHGRTHHHAPHAHASVFHWEAQRRDLATYVAPLVAAGIEVVNASPGSAVPLWPIVSLEDYL